MEKKPRQVNKATAIQRTSVPFIDELLGWSFPILDHGFIRVIDYLGDDHAIDEAARMSYGAGTKRTTEAQGLINYLMNHKHTSPFEMCEVKFHIKLPIFVMRQLVRQRMASLNEYSARYSKLSDEFYMPELEDLMHQSKDNKQGRATQLPQVTGEFVQGTMEENARRSYDLYEHLLSDDIDLARELARINLPVSYYTELYWKIDLHNLFKFLHQRTDSHAQKEIRDYADFMEWLVSKWVPMAWKAYRNYIRDAISFSGAESLMVRVALENHASLNPATKPTYADQLSNREWKEFVAKIKRIA